MRVEIVPMRALDIEEVANIEQACFPDAWISDFFAEELKSKHTRYFLAKAGLATVGYIGILYVLDEAQINKIAVAPAARRQGIAKALLQKAERFCREKKMISLSLEVRVSNEAAIRLYEQTGFSRIAVRKNYYVYPREDALIMTKYYQWEKEQA